MIRIKIELVPFGIESEKRGIGHITIENDGTGTKTNGNYNVKLSKIRLPNQLWKNGRVEGFPRRKLGAYDLLYRSLKNIIGDRNV